MLPCIPSPAERRIRREARSETFRERALALRQAGWTYAAIGVALGLSPARARQIIKKAERLSNSPHWYDILPARARHFVYAQGWDRLPEIEAARQVAQLSRCELMNAPNFGRVACDALLAWLTVLGFEPRSSP